MCSIISKHTYFLLKVDLHCNLPHLRNVSNTSVISAYNVSKCFSKLLLNLISTIVQIFGIRVHTRCWRLLGVKIYHYWRTWCSPDCPTNIAHFASSMSTCPQIRLDQARQEQKNMQIQTAVSLKWSLNHVYSKSKKDIKMASYAMVQNLRQLSWMGAIKKLLQCYGSKHVANLLNGWMLPNGGVASGRVCVQREYPI